MANEQIRAAAAADGETAPKQQRPRTTGYLADNWATPPFDTPALIVNPHARPFELLAWCWAEVKSMQAAAWHQWKACLTML